MPTAKWFRRWRLWAVCSLAYAAGELAIVRPFATDDEVQSVLTVFDMWTQVPPCASAPTATMVDVHLVYSRNFAESPRAEAAANNLKARFENGTYPWASCFRSLLIHEVNLTDMEDVYDPRGYIIRKAWVSGPNKVFRSVLRGFVDKTYGEYSHFYFMEFDAVPVRENWLDQFVTEALYYPSAAIRGSHYRGDTWDPFLKELPVELLYHVNGNAIYSVDHPWTQYLLSKLEDPSFQVDSIAFDIWMANLSYAEYGGMADSPYMGDSLLVGNYAQMLINSSFESVEYIRHGSSKNVFENIDDTELTLGVRAQSIDFSSFLDSLQYNHPFRKVIIMGTAGDISNEQNYSINTVRGTTEIRTIVATQDPVEMFCEIASQVTTRYFSLADTNSIVASPTNILVNSQGHPVLPYIDASSWYCQQLGGCPSEIAEAETFYGVNLFFHHDTFETVYYTSLFQQHCSARAAVLSELASHEECGFVHGPTADGYMAWMLSQPSLSFDYVPRSKTSVGFRSWNVMTTVHSVDTRECSVYREEDVLTLTGNLSACAQILESPAACDAQADCTWRPLFGSGKCIETPQVMFTLTIPQFVSSTTTTATTTRSTTTETFTVLPGQCPLPIADVSVMDVMDCLGKAVGETCQVTCVTGLEGAPAELTCGEDETFAGSLPTCSTTTMTSTMTTTVTELVLCSGGLPVGRGVVTSACNGLANGQICEVTCDTGFQGGPVEYMCNPSTGLFEGPGLECLLPTCPTSGLPAGFDASDCANTEVFDFCFLRCPAGFVAAESVFNCQANQSFSGTAPTCEQLTCSTASLPQDISYNISSCIGTLSGGSCEVSCKRGYAGSTSTFNCGLDGVFQGTASQCVRKPCPAPAASPAYTTTCDGVSHGDLCLGTCATGYTGSPTQLECDDGTLLGNVPNCTALTCSLEGLVIGVGVDPQACVDTTTGSTCELACGRGYAPRGSGTLACLDDGSFNSSGTFTCQPVLCNALNTVSPFSEPQFDDSCVNKVFGDICTAFCETGWEIQGNATVMMCDDTNMTANAGFAEYVGSVPAGSSSGPVCSPKACTIGVPNVRGTQNDCTGKTTGETCTATAQMGFTMTDSAFTCNTQGAFDGTMATVTEASCPDVVVTDPNVASSCQDKKVGDECWFYCVGNFAGGPPQPYECSAATLTFQPKARNISCIPPDRRLLLEETSAASRRLTSCSTQASTDLGLDSPQYDHTCNDGGGISSGEVCIAHCSRGYTLSGSASVISCNTGSLAGSLPSCTPDNCTYNMPSAVGLEHNCAGVATGGSCQAGCTVEGFQYAAGSSAETFTCQDSGEFSGTLPTCERITCTDLSLSDKFAHNCESMVFQDTCGVSCAKGWTLVGWGSQYECQADGTITGVLPDCVGNPCENTIPNDQAFSGEDCDGMTTGLTCNVTCKPGSVPNSALMTCDGSGTLIGTLPLCKPASCPVSSVLQDPSIAHNCDDVAFGRSCSVYCAPGYELTGGGAGEAWSCVLESGALTLSGTLPSCQPIVCPALNPSDVLVDNCTGLTAGQSCQRRCRDGFLPANASSTTFNCDLAGQVSSDGSDVLCEPVQCSSDIQLPNVVHTCSGVFVNRSCYAFCRDGFQLQQTQVPQWTCTNAASGLAPVSDAPMIDGYALRGTVPVCVALPCQYNIPFGVEYSHDCSNVLTDGTCVVSCATGFEGTASTWTCQPDGLLNGTYPECLEITSTATTTTMTSTSTATSMTSTTTTFWNGTIMLNGFLELSSVAAGRRLQTGVSVLNEGFMNDSAVPEGMAVALAELLNVSEVDVEVNLTIGINNETQDQVVRSFYTAYRPFYTTEEALDFARDVSQSLGARTTSEVGSLINTNLDLVNASYRVGFVYAMTLSIDKGGDFVKELNLQPEEVVPPEEEEEEEDNNVGWLVGAAIALIVCIGLGCFLYFMWFKDREETEKRYAEQAAASATGSSEEPKTTRFEVEEPAALSSLVPDKLEEQPAAADVLIEMRELEDALDELGVHFDMSDENEDTPALENASDDELQKMMLEAGITFEQESRDGDNLQVAVRMGAEDLATALEDAGVFFEDDDDGVVLSIEDEGNQPGRP